ncbi:hypothetical protein PR202_ga11191 [Eleusine coracana subsp. coracana]|uniref:chitinase n=1 Tax=Eleusine coracana subsp. coracana TaxID=191504 RepID=A0AAV5C918_ELECO|nr:hypothetical protein PR202_ga11191 [Eleusine coracana subsp. coracana]
MARRPSLLVALVLAASLFVSNSGVAEASWWSRWRWDCFFPSSRHGGDHDHHHPSRRGVASIVTEDVYRSIFLHKDDAACPAHDFYNYTAFLRAADRFPGFAAAGDLATRKREAAAFLAQISHETTGGWATAPDGPYAWGLCFKEEVSPPSDYCDANNTQWPCVPGKNYNYGPAGKALGFDGLGEPELVASDPYVAFETALWFWMTPQPPKPSCHDVMVGRYKPSDADTAANRVAGFGLTTNIINGRLECGIPDQSQVNDRVGYFHRYCDLLGVDVGANLDCANQKPYGSS